MRALIAGNIQDILEEVSRGLEKGVKTKTPLWVDVAIRELAVLVNVSIETSG